MSREEHAGRDEGEAPETRSARRALRVSAYRGDSL
jgi:hypothetical protein